VPRTFGSGLAGFTICSSPSTILAHNLSAGAAYGLLDHFWCVLS
jgi:hypothetical protein